METMAGQTLPKEATAQTRRLRRRTNRLILRVAKLWREHADPDFDAAYAGMMPELFALLDAAQYATATDALTTTPEVTETIDGTNRDPAYRVDAGQWVGVNGNGMNTIDTMWGAIVAGKRAIQQGAAIEIAFDRIEWTLVLRTRTLMADTMRSAQAVAARSRDPYARYVRCLTPPSCARCIILAGKSSGPEAFQRHPECDCTAVYTTHPESGMLTDPTSYLNELDDVQLASALGGESYARAYRDGADLYQLVNAQRGIRRAQIYGQDITYTTEGTTRRGLASQRMISAGFAKEFVKNGGRYTKVDRPRLMPETIYERCANNPEKARQMLRDYGWIL